MSDRDYKYLNASRELKDRKYLRRIGIVTASILSIFVMREYYYSKFYNQYGYCPQNQGIVGEKIGEGENHVCFRFMITSGDKQLFLSDTNYSIEKGGESFRKGEYTKAIRFFERAIKGNRNDPVPQIYLNNSKARLAGNSLKIAVVVAVDYYEETAKDVLRGVADAQDEFNNNVGKDGRLLEIVIANDGNEPEVSKRVANDLSKQTDILGIIGHHASESSHAALPIYEKSKLAMVSPTSASSKLNSKVFFRTVNPTKISAKKYAEYVKEDLHLNKIITAFCDFMRYNNNNEKTSF